MRTVGIDIGTTTSHLIFSELGLERQGLRLSSAYAVLERTVVHRSDVTLTPYSSPRRIDVEALRAFVERSYREAGWTREDVDSGAVIATGEAARKENAAAIVALFSGEAGKFVCATAGHHLESILAAHGSGAVARSRSVATSAVLNVDIGGGTTKYAVCRAGRVEVTAAIDLGARNARSVREGGVIDDPDAVAAELAEVVLRVPRGRALDARVWLTHPLPTAVHHVVVFSGGVGEYINGWHDQEHGDLGLRLGRAIAARIADLDVVRPVESIRATCIGASQYTVQVSGDTLFLTHPVLLPLRDLAAVPVRPAAARADAIAAEVRAGIERIDRQDGAFALAVRWPHGPAYAALRELAQGIADGTRSLLPAGRPLVVVLDADVAGIVGSLLRDELHVSAPVLCIDQIALSDLDFIDVGAVVPEREVVPVVIKSLVFAERA